MLPQDRMIRIAEEVGVIESPFALQPFRIDGEPTSVSEIENVPVVYVTVQRDHVARIGKKPPRGVGTTGEYFAFASGDQRLKTSQTAG
ncbi:hypothetical protein A7Y00_14025 [Stenotrophomonas maltophilia]|nr:hypothetical protein A7Y00_14025 [Stenotrophomonas maltophilia]